MGPWEEFGNFRSQVAFQGGNGQVAVGRDQAGRTIVAAMVKVDAGLVCTVSAERDANPSNAIVVARITGSAEGGTVEWTLAGYSYSTLGGKELLRRIEPFDARDNLAHRGLGRIRRVGHGH